METADWNRGGQASRDSGRQAAPNGSRRRNGRMNELMNELMDELMNELMNGGKRKKRDEGKEG